MEILLNKDYGGYGLSLEAKIKILQRKGIEFFLYEYDEGANKSIDYKNALEKYKNEIYDLPRITTKYFGKEWDSIEEAFENMDKTYRLFEDRLDKDIIAVVKELKEKANSRLSKICIIEMPDNYHYVINNYDGIETVYCSKSEIIEL